MCSFKLPQNLVRRMSLWSFVLVLCGVSGLFFRKKKKKLNELDWTMSGTPDFS